MTHPLCAATWKKSVNSVLVNFPGLSPAPSYSAQDLLSVFESCVILTQAGSVDDFLDGFTFALNIEVFSFLDDGVDDNILDFLMLFDTWGLKVLSYKEEPPLKHTGLLSFILSERLLVVAVAHSTQWNVGDSCSCDSPFPMLKGMWHSAGCPMHSEVDYPVPSCSMLLNGFKGLDKIIVSLKQGQIVVRTVHTDGPVIGNILSDLISLAKTRFIDYLDSLGYRLDSSLSPPEFIHD